ASSPTRTSIPTSSTGLASSPASRSSASSRSRSGIRAAWTSRLSLTGPSIAHGRPGRRLRSALDVEPGAARSRVGEALAPGGDGLARVRDADLAVVAVDLSEAVHADVAGRS